jgi:hypothetical protein
MQKLYSILILLLLLPIHPVAHSYELSCERNINESELLKQSPNGAIRISKHILEVKYSRGSKRFIDKPPHENLDGTHWEYCGYNKETGIHLIHKQNLGRFTGSLLFEDTGRTLSAGQTVLIDSKMKYILGIEQKSGMDGELWSLLDFSGKKLWSGYAGITKKAQINGSAYDAVYAQFENPHLDSASYFIADFVCSDGTKKGVVTLTLIKKHWKWLPEYQCTPKVE